MNSMIAACPRLLRPLALVLVLAMTLTACTTVEQSTVAGVLLGSGLGAVIGHQSGHAVEGALIGAVVGGLAGYLVGRSRTERVASAEETNRSNSYRAVEGLQVKLENASVTPSIVQPGADVDLNATLAVMAPSNSQQVQVRQRVAIYRGSELVGSILEDTYQMTPGTTRISRRVTLQKDFARGRYTYVTHVRATSGDEITETSSETGFTVS